MPRERARHLLRGVAKVVGIVVVAVAVGVLIGIGLSKLSGDDESPAPLVAPDTATDATTSAASTPPAETTDDPASASGTGTALPVTVRVRVLDTVLHPADTDGEKARVTVRVSAENTRTTPLTLDRPTLSATGVSPNTAPRADRSTTFGTLAAGAAKTVTLRFQTAPDLTARLTSERRGQLRIAGRTLPLSVKVPAPATAAP